MTPPFRPAAVVFDLDGVLVETEPLWGEAERAVVESYGRPWDPAVRPLLLGCGPEDAAAVLAEHIGTSDAGEVQRRLTERALAAFEGRVELIAGAAQLVAALDGRVALGVATNSRRVLAEAALDAVAPSLSAEFGAVVTSDDVHAPKPAPDPYLEVCRRLDVAPSLAIAIEDSAVGAQSAKAAGLWVIGCSSSDATFEAADVVVAELASIRADALLNGQAAGTRGWRGSRESPT